MSLSKRIAARYLASQGKKFIWYYDGKEGFMIDAQDYDEAYRKALARWMETGLNIREAVGWFARKDTLDDIAEVDSYEPGLPTLEIAPYVGDLPEVEPVEL